MVMGLQVYWSRQMWDVDMDEKLKRLDDSNEMSLWIDWK